MWIAKIGEHSVAHVSCDDALILGDRLGNAAVVGAYNRPQIFRIKSGRERRRADQIAKHDCKLTPLGSVPRRRVAGLRYARNLAPELRDSTQHLAAMTEKDPEVLQILFSEIPNNR